MRFSSVYVGLFLTGLGVSLSAGCSESRVDSVEAVPRAVVLPAVTTDVVADDPDDPAIWIHPSDPSRSLVFATNKVAAPAGAVVAYGIDGRIRQTIPNLDRPNNIDVEYAVNVRGRRVDIAVTTERLQHRLRVFEIHAVDGRLEEVGVVPVLDGETGDRAEPMGLSLYKRPSDGVLFAIVAPKTGGAADYLAQYRLDADGRGGLRGTLVRRFGNFSESRNVENEIGEIEAVVVDDQLGYVYYADEGHSIRKWHADPDHPDSGRELASFGTEGYQADREGLAIYANADGTGYLVSTDQIEGGSVLKFYPRAGPRDAPHRHDLAFAVDTPADSTDGIDITNVSLPGFPGGLVAMMNSGPRNFLFFRWQDLLPPRPTP